MAASLKSRFVRYGGSLRGQPSKPYRALKLAVDQPGPTPAWIEKRGLCWRSCGLDCQQNCPSASLDRPKKTYLN
ncbi:MAG: hypothetical protein A2527_09290 [Candidatus Lambdaproteobacteria bacterium RIFOXYD2_FULL_50_16]|uniref:4Fe-4S ferredoxin-type domain-containing protein n=1 Tax=Candidatus Lambdaproteobacteria bacterium RIFOXYD2_FULL_50_16 TaxID=1817772 RepID=A0A1F6G7F0_9PROT|nr:MAG: hypothetical protein A2527_09290 [Candidatus Lambdaproteobacteria bacterium RIFOXYD2_FULL_50_16]